MGMKNRIGTETARQLVQTVGGGRMCEGTEIRQSGLHRE